MKVIYVYSELPAYVRVKKNLSILSDYCTDVLYVGANRNGASSFECDFPDNVACEIYDKAIPHGGFNSIISSLGFAKFALEVINENKSDLIIFANEELLWLKFFISYKPRVVCEILDSLEIRTVGLVSFLNPLFKLYCRYFYKECSHLIDVSEARIRHRNVVHKNICLIPNKPAEFEMEKAFVEIEGIHRTTYIYVSGSILPDISGVEVLLKAVELLGVPDFKIVYSGRLRGRWADEVFFSNPNVINLGELTSSQSLLVAQNSIGMFAYYKPINLNYILAAPNKVADALYLSKIIFINSECKVSELTKKASIGLTARFDDYQALANNISNVLNECFMPCSHTAKYVYEKNFSENAILRNWEKVLLNHEL
ncbi:glycosyltransferase family 4 protein [Pseudoalteromonas xiamenensis]|uniref:glycosyltransferase family 4 protein n=1 Tax=Pseudoalteromonas xiamenensis TaxID=882626 RepID=UPI0035EF5685